MGCDAHLDPRLASPVMQAPSYTGSSSGNTNELGVSVSGGGSSVPADTSRASLNSTDTANRSDCKSVAPVVDVALPMSQYSKSLIGRLTAGCFSSAATV